MRKFVLAGAILALVPGFAFAQSVRICQSTVFQDDTYLQCNDGTTTVIVNQPAPLAISTPAPAPDDPDLTSPDPNVRMAAIVRDWPSP